MSRFVQYGGTPASIATLSRVHCAVCKEETLHASSTCIHCKSVRGARELTQEQLDSSNSHTYRNGIQVLRPPKLKRGPGRPRKVRHG